MTEADDTGLRNRIIGAGAAVAIAVGALIAFHAGAAEAPADPKAAWEASLAEYNAHVATERIATLKIDDAIYLKPGEDAALVCEAKHCHWQLGLPRNRTLFEVSYDGKTAIARPGGADLLKAEGPTSVSPTLDVTANEAQIEPGKMGLRVTVFNQDNPKAAAFAGVDYFPYNPDFIIEAAFEPLPAPEPHDFQTSRGWWKRFYRVGFAVFAREGHAVRLPLYAGGTTAEDMKSLSAFFTDAHTGTETYGVGRYVDAELDSFPQATVTLDFNYAYNPACAISPHFNCPVAEDDLPFAVSAGERKPKGADH